MTHPRLSVSALSSVRWSFDEDLACWRELGVGWAGPRTTRRWIDAVAKYDGWSLYLTPGRPTGAVWEQLLDTLADAVAPSVEYARDQGVRLAFEPSRRTEVSFVNTLADAVDVAERTGLGIVADIGNFWMERDLRATLLRAAPRIDLVQLTDVAIGAVRSPDDPPSGGRAGAVR